MSRAGLVDHYIKESHKPGFEIDQIRKELESKEVPEEEIRTIFRLVDSEMQRKVLVKETRNRSKEYVGVGAVLTLIGLGITIGTYTGMVSMGNSFLLMYGPIIAGFSFMIGGWVESRR
ncbi:MAG: hypothetical protein ABJG47_05410 [Ekhidna sp.]